VESGVGVCVVDPELKCQTDSDCPEDMGCVFTDACAECAPCEDAAACPPCPACPVMEYGICMSIAPEPVRCSVDDDCQEGEVCRTLDSDPTTGFCEVAFVDVCYLNEDCSDGEHCAYYPTFAVCCMLNEPCEYPNNGLCKGECAPDEAKACWSNEDCADGQVCELPLTDYHCGGDRCIPAEGGTCVAACITVTPNSHGMCEMLLGVVFDGTQCVYESGCSCGSDCSAIFDSFEACQKACNLVTVDERSAMLER